jgi:ribosome-associated protein
MEHMSDNKRSDDARSLSSEREHVDAIAALLEEHRGRDTVAMYVGEAASFTDYFIISTASSMGHLRGLHRQVEEHLHGAGIPPLNPHKRGSENAWTLLDCGFVVIHLMTDEMREFYDLEHLWFGGEVIYRSSTASNTSSDTS